MMFLHARVSRSAQDFERALNGEPASADSALLAGFAGWLHTSMADAAPTPSMEAAQARFRRALNSTIAKRSRPAPALVAVIAVAGIAGAGAVVAGAAPGPAASLRDAVRQAPIVQAVFPSGPQSDGALPEVTVEGTIIAATESNIRVDAGDGRIHTITLDSTTTLDAGLAARSGDRSSLLGLRVRISAEARTSDSLAATSISILAPTVEDSRPADRAPGSAHTPVPPANTDASPPEGAEPAGQDSAPAIEVEIDVGIEIGIDLGPDSPGPTPEVEEPAQGDTRPSRPRD